MSIRMLLDSFLRHRRLMRGDASEKVVEPMMPVFWDGAIEPLEPRMLLSATLKVLPLGDSITAGDSNWNTYRRPLYHLLTEAGYDVDFIGSHGQVAPNPDFDVDNEGHGGWRTDELIKGRSWQAWAGKLSDWLQTYTPDAVLLHSGTNDLNQGQNPTRNVNELGTVIDILRADNPNVTVFVAQIIPSAAKTWSLAAVQEFNAGIPALVAAKNTAQSRVIVVDQYSGFDVYTDTFDLTHPNVVGEQKMANNWFAAFTSVFGGTTPPPPADAGAVMVTPTSGLVTSESGQQASFAVKLSKAPTANVLINLSVSHPGEAALSTTNLTFTSANWNTAQTVTVTGVDDAVVDGDVAYTLLTAPAISADAAFNGVNGPDVTAINLDNDVAGGTPVDEFGNTRDTATTIDPIKATGTRVISGNIGYGSDQEDWIRVKFDPTVTITVGLTGLQADANVELWTSKVVIASRNTGTSDEKFTRSIAGGYYYLRVYSADGGPTPYTLTINSVPQGATPTSTPGQVVVSPTSGLITTESGAAASFGVKLSQAPTADVLVGLSLSDTSEALLSASSLLFTAGNWNTVQTVIVTGKDDGDADGDVAYTILTAPAVSADGAFSGVNGPDISAINLDNEAAPPPDTQPDDFGNSRDLATTIDPMPETGTRVIQGHIGGATDPEDWIRVKFAPSVTITVALTGLSGNVNVELWTSREVIGSWNAGAADELFTRSIAGGYYYLRLYSVDAAPTPYTLTIHSVPQAV